VNTVHTYAREVLAAAMFTLRAACAVGSRPLAASPRRSSSCLTAELKTARGPRGRL
jgi:hypothetical protein